ncbi:PTS system, ascorbate-specific IIB component [Pelagirhabdus alkalitolerans]|uniref:PTS system, ascorbate-specific IIB component n=1 Tax=Pelagirhabdus alkalitolerans TaxID=1612202 RepID=A0A1G6GG68_9BACI|nr:PTS sugar transporter subunit IIB [Pelagirhabdus alkalitolerans]SDB81001.1 PTS system, ascorbate-specific IIB component [Pelagirhabdus alkalitolerans]
MLSVVTVCGAGVGTSMMLKKNTKNILREKGIEAEVDSSDIGSLDSSNYDLVVTTTDFANVIRSKNVNVLKIDNLTDKDYLREELLEKIKEMGV